MMTPTEIPQNALREHLSMAYPTPILVYPWPDSEALNADLHALIVAAEQAGPGIVRSNIGGWHSTADFFGRDAACIRTLLTRIERVMVELTRVFLSPSGASRRYRFQVEGWANLLRQGGYHNVHNHPNAHWSGVYYVSDNPQVAGRPMSGKLEFIDPRSVTSMLHADDISIYGRQLLDPRAGVMVVFPSWLQHQVHPYFGDGERIAVSFNVVVAAAGIGVEPAPSVAATATPASPDEATIWSRP